MKPFFTVVIPTLNEEHYLPVLLESLAAQTEKSFEVIVVDGYSEDKTRDVAKKYERAVPLSFYTVKKRSVSYQRNYGASKAHGTYLIFIDADCKIGPQFTSALRRTIERTHYKVIFPKMRGDDRNILVRMAIGLSNYYISISQKWDMSAVPVGMCVMERSLFKKIGGYYGEEYQLKHILFPEDQEIIERAKKAGATPYFFRDVPFTVSLRRFRTNGLATVYSQYLYNIVMITLRSKFKVAPLQVKYEQGGHVYKPEKVTDSSS